MNKEISEEQKQFYRQQLNKDSSKDFKSEFLRTTDLERKLVDEYGFEAVRFLFESQNHRATYFQLGEFPPDCPWINLNDKHLIDCIETVFAPVSHKISNLLESLKKRCRFVYAEKAGAAWKLHYFLDITLYDGREYFRIYTGGGPSRNAVPNESLKKFGWTIPRDLAEFYSIHDGFGEISNEIYVQNSAEISVMGEMMNPLCKEQNLLLPEEYSFNDLLEFFPDGGGNAQCFYRKNDDSFNALTVDWDHETWEISGEQDLYEFIDERMSELDEE
jgi:hypothetical protein